MVKVALFPYSNPKTLWRPQSLVDLVRPFGSGGARVVVKSVGHLDVVGTKEHAFERSAMGLARLGFSRAEAAAALAAAVGAPDTWADSPLHLHDPLMLAALAAAHATLEGALAVGAHATLEGALAVGALATLEGALAVGALATLEGAADAAGRGGGLGGGGRRPKRPEGLTAKEVVAAVAVRTDELTALAAILGEARFHELSGKPHVKGAAGFTP
jgi:hypothetical protein